MIRPRYALQLAHTKLKSKRGVLIASIIVSSILFAALIAAVIVFTGAEKSAAKLVKAAGNDRYQVLVSANHPQSVISFYTPSGILPLETVREIKAHQKSYYEAERAKYKQLGIEYDVKSEVEALTPSSWAPETLPEEQRVMVNYRSPVVEDLLNKRFEEYAKTAPNTFDKLKQIGARYGASGYYTETLTGLPQLPLMRVIQDGKENFADQPKNEAYTFEAQKLAIYNSAYSFKDDALLSRYLLTDNTANLKGIPVVPTAQEVAKLFGSKINVGAEPTKESERNAWFRNVQEKAKNFTYQVCYRNEAEGAMLEKIQRDFVEEKANKDNKDYKKPALQYQYPDTPCGDIIVKQDMRTAAEKKADAALEETQKKLGTYQAPAHRILTFQIVGVIYAQPFQGSFTNASDFVKSLLSPGDMRSVSAPVATQMYQSLPASLRFDELTSEESHWYQRANKDFKDRILEFSTIEQARAFLKNEGCAMDGSECKKPFQTSVYGSNYLILDEIGKLFTKVMTIAFPVLLGLAFLIMWFTVSRIMAENRKETAVYRAMGAKRGDITGIYVTYVLIVALRIAVLSIILGAVAAYAINYFYGSSLTSTAYSLVGTIDTALTVSLFDLSSPLLLVIIVSIFIVSLVASIHPLIRNVLRPPVQDMRSE